MGKKKGNDMGDPDWSGGQEEAENEWTASQIKSSGGLMTFDELVADIKRQITIKIIETRTFIAEFELSVGIYTVKATTDGSNLFFLDELHTLQQLPTAALQKAFGQAIAELAKEKWGINFDPNTGGE